MGLRKIIKKGISFGFSPKKWIGIEQVKGNGKICMDIASQFVNSSSKAEEAEQPKKYPKKNSALFSGLSFVFLISALVLWACSINMMFVLVALGLCFFSLYLAGRETKEAPKASSEKYSKRQQSFMMVGVYALIGFVLLGYTFYLWFSKAYILQGCMSLVISLFIFMYSVRELIIYYQLKFNKKNITLINLPHYLFKGSSK